MSWPDLAAHGFSVTEAAPTPQTSVETMADPFRLLEPYAPMEIRFCAVWDDAVRLTRDGRAFTAFGVCPFGVFLRDDGVGAVVLYALDRVTFDTDLVPVNAGLAQFVSCYSSFLAAVFIAKSRAAAESGLTYLTEAAAWLEEQVRLRDPGALAEGSFWSHLTYYLDDDGVPLRSPCLRDADAQK